MARKKGGRRAAKAQPKRKRTATRTRKSAARSVRKTARGAAKRAAASSRKRAPVRKTSVRKPATRKKVARPAPRKKASAARKATGARKAARRPARKPARPAATASRVSRTSAARAPKRKSPQIDRERRILREEREAHGVPSSLDLERRGSAARTGREELSERQRDYASLTPGITAGDVDASVQNAYFSGEEAPGGDTPTPDQDVVEEIGQALGIQYQDNEELSGGEKVAKRDRRRWELDPASSEDYQDRNVKE